MDVKQTCWLCGDKATVTEVEAHEEWLAMEGCACGGFLIWAGLWKIRLPNLSTEERQLLSSRIRRQPRHPGGRIRVATEDGKPTGPIVIETRGPSERTA